MLPQKTEAAQIAYLESLIDVKKIDGAALAEWSTLAELDLNDKLEDAGVSDRAQRKRLVYAIRADPNGRAHHAR